jgi:hypothetical protein
MWGRLLSLIAYPLVVILLITFVAALLLAAGTALTLIFAVSVWEATVVVTVVAAGAFWLFLVSGLPYQASVYPEELFEEEEVPRIAVTGIPTRSSRRRRRR